MMPTSAPKNLETKEATIETLTLSTDKVNPKVLH